MPPAALQSPSTPPTLRASHEGQQAPAEFDAEECLARGQADRALVIASRALKDRPGSLTLLALVERARKAVLRGKRGERLEQRVRDARALAEEGSTGAAERIVVSALKLVPDHAGALALFSQLRQRRLDASTPEAEAERELERLSRRQARQALDRARALKQRGDERAAFVAVRRGLRVAPDEPDLLALFAELHDSLGRVAAQRASARARVRQARTRMEEGRYPESRVILREVLDADPGFGPAHTAMEELEVWARQAQAPTPPPPRPARVPPVRSSPVPRPKPVAKPPVPARRPARSLRPPLAVALVLGAAVVAGVWYAARPSPSSSRRPSAAMPVPAEARRSSEADPLARLEPASRTAVEDMLAAYARALETADTETLARIRPDLSPSQREAMLRPFREADNAGVDLRVLSVVARGHDLELTLVRTDIIVGEQPTVPEQTQETLRLTLSASTGQHGPDE